MRVGALLLGLVLVVPLLELGHRALLRARGTPWDGEALAQALRRSVDTTAAFVPADDTAEGAARGLGILHPFTGGEKYHDTGAVLRTFREGLPDDAYTVLVVGGSVAASWSEDHGSVFRQRLEADPRLGGKRVHILPYAHAAYKQPQQANRVAYLFAYGYRPDAVINLDGFNEVANGCENALGRRTHPLFPSPPVWGGILHARRDPGPGGLELLIEMRLLSREVAELADTTLEYGLTRSSLLGTWVRRRMNALNTRRAELQNALQQVDASRATGSRDWQMLGPEFQGGAEEAVRLSAQCWFEGSLDLQRMCAARGIYYLHALQPTLIDPGSKPPSPEEQALPVSAQGWKPGVRYGYPLLRQLGAGLAEHGVAFVDLTSAFESVTESLYFDECHVLPPGNRILSERIADAFLARMPAPR